ncbi:hypothetical protein [Lactiplantibacillus paraxiangfangensis]|uniref:hypothetical protein n=1 Tax=Lactiplantibacillus paraxiangfangensis TaxID=3076224 RepID=UPI0030C75543
MVNGENKRAHLQMIEDVISRMSSNSFLIKGWSFTVIGSLVTLYLTQKDKKWSYAILVLSLVFCVLFWLSDAYYLMQERRFRKLYEKISEKKEDDIDFSMKLPESDEGFLCCMIRPVFLISYGIIAAIQCILLYFLK